MKPKFKLVILAEFLPPIISLASGIVLVVINKADINLAVLLLILGVLAQIVLMLYRMLSYLFAFLLEVSPAMQNMTDVLRGLFKGRSA